MDGDAQGAQVVHAQHAAYHIPAQVIEDQHLPYGLAVCIQYLGGGRECAVRSRIVLGVARLLKVVVEVQDALDRGFNQSILRDHI
jgi:hypothetical protein